MSVIQKRITSNSFCSLLDGTKKIFSAFSSQSWDENNFRHAQQSQNSCAVNSYFHYASLQEFHGKFSVFWPAPSLEF